MIPSALAESLDLVVERVGDPAPQIYERMFRSAPELEPLFVLDGDGAVRAQMVGLCFEALLDLEREGHYARGLLATEMTNHASIGVAPAQFASLFSTIRDVVREISADRWQPRHEQAWCGVLSRVGDILNGVHGP